jgi:hypothetical protein
VRFEVCGRATGCNTRAKRFESSRRDLFLPTHGVARPFAACFRLSSQSRAQASETGKQNWGDIVTDQMECPFHLAPIEPFDQIDMSASSSESTKYIKLSAKGLERVASLRISDFAFKVGEEQFGCSRSEAAFISPRITALLLQDPTIDEYEIEVGSDHEFAPGTILGLISLARNGVLEVTKSNVGLVKRIAKSLENSELCEALKEFVTEGGEVNSSNVVERLSLSESLGVDRSEALDYLASHFYGIDGSLLLTVSHEDLRNVLRSEQLRIWSEDSLLDFILERGFEYFDLLGCLRTEYLSQAAMSRLLESISPDEIGAELWHSLCRRLLLYGSSPQLPNARYMFLGECFPLDSSQPFKGIIAHLSSECGGNVHMHGIISVSASSVYSHACYQVADYDWPGYWTSGNEERAWIQFDFKGRRVSPSHYTMKSDGNCSGHLLKWSLDGSDDGVSWITLDQQETKDLEGKYVVKSYACAARQVSIFFQYIRLTQTGPNSSGGHCLRLANLELFGQLRESRSV